MCGQSKFKHRYREGHHDFFNRGPISEREWREFQRFRRQKNSPEARFYKHLTWYLAIMGLFLYKNHGNIFSFLPIALFWGIGVLIHYYNVFGWPNQSNDHRDPEDEDDADESENPQPKGPNWSEKDLV